VAQRTGHPVMSIGHLLAATFTAHARRAEARRAFRG
jgi:hypothetical protein